MPVNRFEVILTVCPVALFESSRRRVMSHVGAQIQPELSGEVFRSLIQKTALKKTGTPRSVRDLDKVRTFLGLPVAMAFFDLA